MIVPWLKGFLKWDMAPITWTLVILNFLIFAMTYEPSTEVPQRAFNKAEQLLLTGYLYHQYRGGKDLPQRDDLILLGAQGLRDIQFVKTADGLNFKGDEVAIDQWKRDLAEFRQSLFDRQVRVFGLSFDDRRPLTWITYQFMHAGWMHLLGNMLMLVIFAGAIEILIGGWGLLVVYLLGGIAGALGFLWLGQSTLAPMIGASGSLSSIMAFYALYEKKRRVSFFYFLSPIEGYFGWIHLPTWLIFPLCFVTDLAAYFSTSREISSGVAYTAHIGGVLFGILAAMAAREMRKNARRSPVPGELST